MKLIAGLGNPGAAYQGTRHNIGFAVLDELARRAGVEFQSSPVDALVARVRPTDGSEPVLFAKPMTWMNRSGDGIAGLLRYFRIDQSDLLVVVDDADLPLGRLRARASGSAGGHNGLRSIIQHLGEDFARLRVGVGRGFATDERRKALADHVLARFDRSELAEVERMIARAADAAETFITSGIAAVMNRFNSSDPAVTE